MTYAAVGMCDVSQYHVWYMMRVEMRVQGLVSVSPSISVSVSVSGVARSVQAWVEGRLRTLLSRVARFVLFSCMPL